MTRRNDPETHLVNETGRCLCRKARFLAIGNTGPPGHDRQNPVERLRMPCTAPPRRGDPRYGPGRENHRLRDRVAQLRHGPIIRAWRTTTCGSGVVRFSRCGRGSTNPGTRRRRPLVACGLQPQTGWCWRARPVRRRHRRGGGRRRGAGSRVMSPPRSGFPRPTSATRWTKRGRRIVAGDSSRQSNRVGLRPRRCRRNHDSGLGPPETLVRFG